jgi:N-acetylneuraminic acid mutarotase
MKTVVSLVAVLFFAFLLPTINAMPTDETGQTLPVACPVGIISPINRTYSSNMLTLNISTVAMVAANIYVSMTYSLDEKENQSIPLTTNARQNSFQAIITGSVALPTLSEGEHKIMVYAKYEINANPPHTATDQDNVYFTVNTLDPNASIDTTPPTITNISIENKTYRCTELPLSFNLNETVSWIAYSLDDQANRTLAGLYNPDKWGTQFDTTLKALSMGLHSIIVYVSDTSGNTGASNKIYFTLEPDFWTTKVPITQARTSLGVAVVSGKIYAICGFSSDQAKFLSVNEEYNPATDNWNTKAAMPTPRSGCAVTVCQNKIYVIGGQTEFFNGTNVASYETNVTEVYDSVTNTWTTKAPIPTNKVGFCANTVGDKIYIMSGSPNGNLNLVYDSVTNSWTTKLPIPTATYFPASAVLDGKIYLISGQGFGNQTTGLTQIYDPNSDTWSTGAPIPVSISQAAAGATTGIAAPKAIYVIGGSTEFFKPGENLTQVYFPENNTWTTASSMPTARAQLAIAVVNDTIYAIGGTNSRTPLSTSDQGSILLYVGLANNEKYLPLGYGTPDPNYQPLTQSSSIISSPTPVPLLTASPLPLKPPTPFASPTPSPSSFPLESQTQQPTASPNPTANNIQSSLTTTTIILGSIIATSVGVGLWIYLRKNEKMTKTLM